LCTASRQHSPLASMDSRLCWIGVAKRGFFFVTRDAVKLY
jgi:hypothetical protein